MEDVRENVTHKELMNFTSNALNELLSSDSFLNYLPKEVTVGEIKNEIALVYGQSMTIIVQRDDGNSFRVIVPQSGSRVFQLKRAIQRTVNLKLQRSSSKRKKRKKISWRYIWRAYYLSFDNKLFDNDFMLLSDLGLYNKAVVTFVKRRRLKNASSSS